MTRAAFTTAELVRAARGFEAVGERVGGVEKRADGSVRFLTLSEVRGAPTAGADDERRMAEAFGEDGGG